VKVKTLSYEAPQDAALRRQSRAEERRALPQSRPGGASLLTVLVVLLCGLMVFAAQDKISGFTMGRLIALGWGLCAFAGFPLALLGLLQRNRRRSWCVLGLLLNFITAAAPIGLIVWRLMNVD
jgi:hypothetical protein